MITSVEGILVAKQPALATVRVGGVGLAVHIPLSTFGMLPDVAEPLKLFTYLHVREDQLKLYGFASDAERDLFVILLGVNMIGPGVALQVLSSCNVEDFCRMIANGEVTSLASMVKGVGKKTAERMIMELKDTIGAIVFEADAGHGAAMAADDAVKALIELGSSPSDARKEVAKAVEQTGSDATLDTVLRTVFHNR